MYEIDIANAEMYLRERHGIAATRVQALSGGVSNVVLRVETAGEPFVLKQSRPQLRTRDAWFSDLDRIYREQEVMQALVDRLPPLTVPRVLFADRENFVFAMSHAPIPNPSSPEGARGRVAVWKESLLAGDIDPAMGERAGRVLGMMHEATARDPGRFGVFRDRTVFVQLRVDPFYRKIQERRPEVADAVQALIDSMMMRQDALCHGDYTPKNMLVHGQGFMLVDYETAHFGDPAMDLGLFLTHLLLKAVRRPGQRSGYFELIEGFWRSYRAEVRCQSLGELEQRGVAHWGAGLLARIDGTSPVDYLPEERRRESVRRLGRLILRGAAPCLGGVLDRCDRELSSLERAAENGVSDAMDARKQGPPLHDAGE
ncbi:MAG: aminoglycoside phosphotransferase family protein [Gemmataceae bacterium]|nr:aminoglycoside phosphotransferase family protein [Gemmataceae bacterium]